MKKEINKVKVSELKVGVIREQTLPKGFIERVIKYKKILKEVEKSTVEEAINNFMRDMHPENELEIWESIASVYEKITKKNKKMTYKEKRELFAKILLRSCGVEQ